MTFDFELRHHPHDATPPTANPAVKSRNLDYSHFISLPLDIHPDLVDKLISFQNSILGTSDYCVDENLESNSNEENTDNEEQDDLSEEKPNVVVELKAHKSNELVEVNLTNVPLVSYAPKASKSSSSKSPDLSDVGDDKLGDSHDRTEEIEIPGDLLISSHQDPIRAIVESTYINLLERDIYEC
ncbi:hypothetical protein K1719_040392 [Acacia pycnantha]|nr:hypothetical protein K1719_040392 [Acacia pycnantha]